jgi:hypothetical protein
MRVGGVVAADPAQEREHVLADDGEHLSGSEVLEARPAKILVETPAAAARDRLLQPSRLVLFECVQVVETPQEEQIRDLLDHFNGIGDAARPEGIPVWSI